MANEVYKRTSILRDDKVTTVSCLTFSSDGDILLCGSSDGTLIAWDTSTRTILHQLKVPSQITCVQWHPISPKSYFFGTISAAYFVRGFQDKGHHVLTGLAARVYSLSFDASSRLLALGIGEEVQIARQLDHLHSFSTCVLLPSPPQHTSQTSSKSIKAQSIHFLSEGDRLVVSYVHHGVICWDVKTRAQIWRIEPRFGDGTIGHTDISNRSGLLALSNYRDTDGMELHRFGSNDFVRSFAHKASRSGFDYALQVRFLHDGQAIACGSTRGEVQIFDTSSGESLQILPHEDGQFLTILTACETFDKRFIATASVDATAKPEIQLWKSQPGRTIRGRIQSLRYTFLDILRVGWTALQHNQAWLAATVLLLSTLVLLYLNLPSETAIKDQVQLFRKWLDIQSALLSSVVESIRQSFVADFRRRLLDFALFLQHLAGPVQRMEALGLGGLLALDG